MALNEKPGTRVESPEASVAETRAASRCAASSDQLDGEHGAEEASRDSKNKPTSTDKVSLQDTGATVSDERNSEVSQGDEDATTSNGIGSEDSQRQESLQGRKDSLDKEPLQRSDDADVSDVPGNPPSNSSDLRRDLAERDIARLSSALTTEQNSGVAVRQISDQSSKSADRRPSPVVESRASRAEEGSDRRTLHSSGRHDPSSKGFQRPPQRVCKTPLQGPPETSGRLELTGSLQNRPATNWRHPTSKRPATSTSSSESPNGDSVREQISPVQDQSVAAQSPAKEVRVNGPKTGSTGFPSPRGSSSPRGSDKGMPGVGDEGSSRASVASSSSSKRRSSPVPPRHNLSPERSSLSENGSEGSRMSTAGSTSPNRLVTPQLKQQHVFDPPWMKKRQRSDTRLLPFFFRSSPETSALLATSTWSRKSPFHAGELRNGGAQRGEPFGSLRSTSNLASSSTQGFLTEKEVGVKQPPAPRPALESAEYGHFTVT